MCANNDDNASIKTKSGKKEKDLEEKRNQDVERGNSRREVDKFPAIIHSRTDDRHPPLLGGFSKKHTKDRTKTPRK